MFNKRRAIGSRNHGRALRGVGRSFERHHRLAFEALERRELLTTDLTSEIATLLKDSQTSTPTTIQDVTLGPDDFLTIPSVTISFEGLQDGSQGWSGTVEISALSATLAAGSFSMSIVGDSTQTNGLGGSYTLGGSDGTSGSYTLTAGDVTADVPDVFTASASDVNLGYDPAGSSSQQIASFGTLSATLIPFDNATVSLADLAIDENGFSLKSGSISADSFDISNILQVTSPTFTFSNFGDVDGATPTGTIGLSATTVSAFPGSKAFNANVTGFSGTYTFGTNAVGLQATDVNVAIGSVFDADVSGTQQDPLSFDYTPPTSTTASSFAFTAGSVTLTSGLFPNIEGTASDLDISSTGLSIGDVELEEADPTKVVSIGGVIEATGLSADLSGFQYTPGQPAVAGTVTLGALSVSLFPSSSLFTSSVTGFTGSYDIDTGALSVSAKSADIKIGSTTQNNSTVPILDISLTNRLTFTLTPAAQGVPEQVSLSAGTVTATLNEFGGITGTINGLTVDNAGFSIASASLSTTQTVSFGGVFKIEAPTVTLDGLTYVEQTGAFSSSSLTVQSNGISLNLGSAVTASLTGDVTATVGLESGYFSLSADTMSATIASILTVTATSPSFTTDPAAHGGDYATFASASASLTLGSGDNAPTINGTATNFAIDSSGFVAGDNFGVTLSLSSSGDVNWPSWLPIQDASVAITWAGNDFTTNPSVFTIDLSADVSGTLAGLTLAGSVQDAVISTALLDAHQFPVTSLGGFGVSISGSMFGMDVEGQLFLATLQTDSDYNAIAEGSSTPVAHSYLYGGIEVGAQLDGVGGFDIKLGLSQLGLLGAYVDIDAPILLDPDTGLTISNLNGGINFDETLPTITDPSQLLTASAFTNPGQQTLAQWEAQLQGQVATQVLDDKGSSGSGFADLSAPMEIYAGATLYSAYASKNAFQLSGEVFFDTTGNFEASGTLTLGDELTVQGGIYIQAGGIGQGNLTIDAYADVPDPADSGQPLVEVYGGINFKFGQTPTTPAADQPSNALGFSGTALSATASKNLVPTGSGSSYSVEFWAQQAATNPVGTYTLINQGGANGLTIGFEDSSSGSELFVTAPSPSGSSSPTITLTYPTDDLWHHWAVVYDANTGDLTLNVDGGDVPFSVNGSTTTVTSTAAGTLSTTSNPFTISGAASFTGAVAEVRIWNTAISEAQILAYMNQNGVPSTSASIANLVADWSFAKSIGDSAKNGPSLNLGGASPSYVAAPSYVAHGANAELGDSLTLNGKTDYATANPVIPSGTGQAYSIEFWAQRRQARSSRDDHQPGQSVDRLRWEQQLLRDRRLHHGRLPDHRHPLAPLGRCM